MRKVMKKILTAALTLAMILSPAAAVKAEAKVPDSSTTETVNITGLPDDKAVTFDTYQVVKGTYDPTYNSLEYVLTDWASAALVGSGTGQYVSEEDALKAIVELTTTGESNTEQAELVNRLAAASGKTAYTDGSGTKVTFTQPDNGNGSYGTIASASLPAGAYLVLAHNNSMSFLNMLVSVDTSNTPAGAAADAWVLKANGAVLKGRELEMDKTITGKNGTEIAGGASDQTVEIGDTLEFTILTDVPQYPSNAAKRTFKVMDTPSHMAIDVDSVSVYGVDSAGNETPLTKDMAYMAAVDSATGVLTVDFSNYYTTVFQKSDGSYPYAQVKITYEAEILSTAALDDGNVNDAKLVYSNDPYSEKDSDTDVPVPDEEKPKAYTFGLDLTKYGEAQSGQKPTLANTVFRVSKTVSGSSVDLVFIKEADGTYKVADSTATADGEDLVTGTNGTLSLIGLDAGVEYVIREYEAPSEYHLNTNTLTFTITAETDPASGKLTGKINSVTATEKLSDGRTVDKDPTWTCGISATKNGVLEMSLTDSRLPALPATGGMGTVLFTVAGAALMLAAVALFLAGRRRSKR